MDMATITTTSAANLLSAQDILLDVEATTKRGVFEQVGALMARRHGLDRVQISNSLYARERLGSTGLGYGVALPHARIKGLDGAVAAYVRTRMPIPFEAPDGKPVSDMIVLVVPDKATDLHLQLLASVAQMFADKAFREKLRLCGDAAEVAGLIAAQARP